MELLATLNWYDWLVAAMLLYGIWSGLRSGLSGEIIATVGLVLMIVLAVLCYQPAGASLASLANMDLDLAHLIAFVSIAALVYLIALAIRQVVHHKRKKTVFSAMVENIGGAAAGVLRLAIVMSWLSVCLCLLPDDFWQDQVGHNSRFGSVVVSYFPAVKETVEKNFGEKTWFFGKVKRRDDPAVSTDEPPPK